MSTRGDQQCINMSVSKINRSQMSRWFLGLPRLGHRRDADLAPRGELGPLAASASPADTGLWACATPAAGTGLWAFEARGRQAEGGDPWQEARRPRRWQRHGWLGFVPLVSLNSRVCQYYVVISISGTRSSSTGELIHTIATRMNHTQVEG